ncbi:MAG: TlpA disulfide reductase family protein [Archangium sp.]|nr:TlpA disulfide reductase family protein [Archangium sp.]
MRSDHALLLSLLVLSGCDEKPSGPPPSRFASVKKNTQASATAFCDKSYPATGATSKRFVPPALRAFGAEPTKPKGWTWLNVWATWCKPCVEEMGVLNRWREAFARESLPIGFELLSIDETSAQPALEEWSGKNLPGPISWIRSEEDFGPFLDALGVERSAAIPIHVLVDPKGMVRCVRVGAIHEQNYGSVRDLIAL